MHGAHNPSSGEAEPPETTATLIPSDSAPRSPFSCLSAAQSRKVGGIETNAGFAVLLLPELKTGFCHAVNLGSEAAPLIGCHLSAADTETEARRN